MCDYRSVYGCVAPSAGRCWSLQVVWTGITHTAAEQRAAISVYFSQRFVNYTSRGTHLMNSEPTEDFSTTRSSSQSRESLILAGLRWKAQSADHWRSCCPLDRLDLRRGWTRIPARLGLVEEHVSDWTSSSMEELSQKRSTRGWWASIESLICCFTNSNCLW